VCVALFWADALKDCFQFNRTTERCSHGFGDRPPLAHVIAPLMQRTRDVVFDAVTSCAAASL